MQILVLSENALYLFEDVDQKAACIRRVLLEKIAILAVLKSTKLLIRIPSELDVIVNGENVNEVTDAIAESFEVYKYLFNSDNVQDNTKLIRHIEDETWFVPFANLEKNESYTREKQQLSDYRYIKDQLRTEVENMRTNNLKLLLEYARSWYVIVNFY
jgi:flagellar motor component MotA